MSSKKRLRSPIPLLAILLAGSAMASAAGAQEDCASTGCNEIIVYGRSLAQIGAATSGSQGVIGYRDFEDKPLGRVGELVENVPGVIATQHSGTGKANQYFLRGFNLDHGTDFAGFVDGAPVNFRTHGHGQGYLDLNFLIPELVDRIDYRKGPYFADVGDFSAAGTVAFHIVDRLPEPMLEATGGSFGYYRGLAAGSVKLAGGDLLMALDGAVSNGPWVLDEALRKVNALARFSEGRWSLGLSAYHARWNATDQVPQRAIDSGLISRWGNIDPYLGGRTTRIGLTANAAFGATKVDFYALSYDFALTSNFTYFLDDPVDGDEFQQRDRRAVFGGSIRHEIHAAPAGIPLTVALGGDARWDHIGKVGLYSSVAGRTTGTVSEDKVDETSLGLYAEAGATLTQSLRATIGVRADLYGYNVRGRPLAANSGTGSDAILSPKFSLAWRPARHVELYADYGEGFHSNDARGAALRADPKTGAPADPVPLLVKARGGEIGARVEASGFTASLVAFHLALGSELVFAGDQGGTQPNAATKRDGVEATLFWRPAKWLTLDAAAAFTRARFSNVAGVPAAEGDHIPNSVAQVVAGGAELNLGGGITGSLRLRHFGSAPLTEDDRVRSRPTTLVNLGAYYSRGRIRLGLDLLNLLDSKADDISYYYASRLPGEPAQGVEDLHIHPVEPREARVSVRYSF